MECLIRLGRVTLGYGGKAVAGPIDLELRRGDFVLVAGPNGAGKSTLVKTLMGVQPPLAGVREASVGGRPIRFGYVPQRERLDDLWPFSVLDIALMGMVPGLGPFRPFGAARKAHARSILELVGMAELADAPFRDLSGGQQQRALIARALVSSPEVLVLDEPTNHLDVPGERAVYELLGQLRRSRPDGAMVVITHHVESALAWANRLVLLRDGSFTCGEPDAMLASGALDDLVRVRPLAPAAREVVR